MLHLVVMPHGHLSLQSRPLLFIFYAIDLLSFLQLSFWKSHFLDLSLCFLIFNFEECLKDMGLAGQWAGGGAEGGIE